MIEVNHNAEPAGPHLLRRFGLLQATALNMANMVGVGPFITIPLLLSAMRGPQGMLGWAVAFAITLSDGMVWSELGAALPGSGGSYVYLREGFGRETFGRLMAFLFIWQFILSGPLEIASGYIGFANYLGYLVSGLGYWQKAAIAAAVGLLTIALLYRRITTVGRITVTLWAGTVLTMLAVIATGAARFDPHLAFDFPPGAFDFSVGFLLGLGAAARIGVYDYLGYYDICYIGDEVKNPGKVIPRSIFISLAVIATCYFLMNLSVISVVPWREFVPADAHRPNSDFIVSIFMERVYGKPVATVFTLLVLWTTVGSVFALLLGYSRIPYAAALDGYFFRLFSRLHPTKNFPHVSLLVIGGISIACCALPLELVIDGLILTRVLVQFMGQVYAVALLRQRAPDMPRPYRIWLYPVPAVVALLGWLFVFATADMPMKLLGLGMVALGVLFFLAWSWRTSRWPFTPPISSKTKGDSRCPRETSI
jgi:amino acid transporter